MQEYEDWTSEPIMEAVDKTYQKALSKLEKCKPVEDALVSISYLVFSLKAKFDTFVGNSDLLVQLNGFTFSSNLSQCCRILIEQNGRFFSGPPFCSLQRPEQTI